MKKSIFIVGDPRAGRIVWLEYKNFSSDAEAAGWPDHDRSFPDVLSKRDPAFGGQCESVSSPCSTSTIQKRRPLVRPPLGTPEATASCIKREVGHAGLCGRLRSSMGSKLRSTGRGRRRLVFPATKGLPELDQASQRLQHRKRNSDIRARRFGRHEHLQRSKSNCASKINSHHHAPVPWK